ncbi:hypothetical protein GCM10010493_77100 [Streptomyces lavendulae subsp. grasserius]
MGAAPALRAGPRLVLSSAGRAEESLDHLAYGPAAAEASGQRAGGAGSGDQEQGVTIGVPVAVSAVAQRVATALPAGAGRYPAADGEIGHQRPGDCANGHLMPLTGTATVPEELPNAPRVLRVFGN